MTVWTLLASSSTPEGIDAAITRFYCGEQKRRDGTLIYRANGTPISGVRVIEKKGRWRFESSR